MNATLRHQMEFKLERWLQPKREENCASEFLAREIVREWIAPLLDGAPAESLPIPGFNGSKMPEKAKRNKKASAA